MNLTDFVKTYIISSEMPQKELADKIGVSVISLYNWKNGINKPRKSHINKIASLYGFKVRWNGDELELVEAEPLHVSKPFKVEIDETRKIPVITQASAGLYSYPEVIDMTDLYIRVPKGLPKEAFGVQVVGDSAEPFVSNGDICVVSPNKPFVNNKPCFIALKNGEFLIKKVEKQNDQLHLISYNQSYDELICKEDEIKVVLNILHTKYNV